MGSGKSQSAISYMNAHPEKRFIYLTPYCNEAARIRKACPALHFIEPGIGAEGREIPKVAHTRSLLSAGKNVASTHAAFCLYSDDMIPLIQQHGYTLIIDESLSVISDVTEDPGDIYMLEKAGFIKQVEGQDYYTIGDDPYTGKKMKDLFDICERNCLIKLSDSDEVGLGHSFYCWELRPNILQAFSEVFILTYLWDGQEIKYFLDLHGIDYDFIGIRKEDDHYEFADAMEYYPSYIANLSDMIAIFDHDASNAIGNDRYALSASWYKRADAHSLERIKKNMYNFTRYYCQAKTSQALYTCFKGSIPDLKSYGIGKHLPCNMRATNEYRTCTVLSYPVNVFTNPFKKRYLSTDEQPFNEDLYALSMMIQWIWRSAIRDGHPIRIYVPSLRMRTLLSNWIQQTMADYHEHIQSIPSTAEAA